MTPQELNDIDKKYRYIIGFIFRIIFCIGLIVMFIFSWIKMAEWDSVYGSIGSILMLFTSLYFLGKTIAEFVEISKIRKR